jgi:hypothetical protein
MYFPYFRGRQYELLALRELAHKNLLGNFVVPVVEPIKITSTFNGTIQAYIDTKKPIALILNPAVGELSFKSVVELPVIDSIMKINMESISIIPSIIMNKNTDEVAQWLIKHNVANNNILAIMTNRDCLESYKTLFSNIPPKYTLFPDERQMRLAVSQNKVLFEDKFNRQERNVDYIKQEDEFYSEDHLYFQDEGYVGFGDYSIIGKEYIEGGFAPYAVVIHIVYFASDKTLRIKHFASDSNEDISDAAGKFQEAGMKLKKWYETKQPNQLTSALSMLLNYVDTGYYPGLPSIKKLSIMHHLELVGKYL